MNAEPQIQRKRRAFSAKVDVRWMIRRDMPLVLRIEEANTGEECWIEEDFLRCLRQRNCIGMVATSKKTGLIAGFMVYELHKTYLHILRFGVSPEWQGLDVGTAMIHKLKLKLSQQRRDRLLCSVPEACLPMQLFLKSQGFDCIRTDRSDDGEPVYVMELWHLADE